MGWSCLPQPGCSDPRSAASSEGRVQSTGAPGRGWRSSALPPVLRRAALRLRRRPPHKAPRGHGFPSARRLRGRAAAMAPAVRGPGTVSEVSVPGPSHGDPRLPRESGIAVRQARSAVAGGDRRCSPGGGCVFCPCVSCSFRFSR